MNKKVLGVLIALGLTIVIIGYKQESVETIKENDIPDQFKIISVEEQHEDIRLRIIEHKETGKRFILYKHGYGSGITNLD